MIKITTEEEYEASRERVKELQKKIDKINKNLASNKENFLEKIFKIFTSDKKK